MAMSQGVLPTPLPPPPPPPETFRDNVVVLVVNERRDFLFCRRKDKQGWQCVQGGVDEGEELVAASVREVYEEVGLRVWDASSDAPFDVHEPNSAVRTDGGALCAGATQREKSHRGEEDVVGAPVALRACDCLHLLGQLPLPDGVQLRYRFPPGACKKWVARGIVGQDQRCVVYAAHSSVIARTDLRGLGGEKREFIEVRWQPMAAVEDVLRLATRPKTHIFRLLMQWGLAFVDGPGNVSWRAGVSNAPPVDDVANEEHEDRLGA